MKPVERPQRGHTVIGTSAATGETVTGIMIAPMDDPNIRRVCAPDAVHPVIAATVRRAP